MKKSRPEERPPAARMDAVERCVERGDLHRWLAENEARDQIAPLVDMKEMHGSEWRSLLLSQIEFSRAADDLPGSRGCTGCGASTSRASTEIRQMLTKMKNGWEGD